MRCARAERVCSQRGARGQPAHANPRGQAALSISYAACAFLCLQAALACTDAHVLDCGVPALARPSPSPTPLQCFLEDVEAGNKLSGSFEVISGGVLDVDVTISGPAGEAHYHVLRQRSGHFTVLAPNAGLYRLCFSSRMSTMVQKTVAFSWHKGDDLYRGIAKQEHVTPLEEEVTRLQDALALVEDEQEYMWAREQASAESEWEGGGGGGKRGVIAAHTLH